MAYRLLGSFAPGPSTVTDWAGAGYGATLRADGQAAWVNYHGHGDAEGTVALTLGGQWWAAVEDPDERTRALFDRDGHVARFDLAADFEAPPGAVGEVATAVRAGEWRTRLRSGMRVEDLATGRQSVYLGSKSSDRRIRVYDERGPVRIEVQARNDYAGELLESVVLHGAVVAHRQVVSGVVGFPSVPWWSAALDDGCPVGEGLASGGWL